MINSLLDINSPQSVVINIILLLGIYNLGKFACKKKILKEVNFKEFHYSLFGLIIISIPIFFMQTFIVMQKILEESKEE